MSTRFRTLLVGASAVAAFGISGAALAQSTPWQGPGNAPVAPAGARPGDSFVGVNVGRATYGTSCGVAGLTCQNNVISYSVTAGNMFTRNFGAEMSLLDFGTAERADGSVTARGINLSAVGRLPLGDYFGLEGKVGTTYGVTHVSAPTDSGIETGKSQGFGFAYGLALDVDIARGLHGQVGWEQHDFHFAGQDMSNVRNITVGLGLRF